MAHKDSSLIHIQDEEPKSYKIDSKRLDRAYQIIESYEHKLREGIIDTNTVLPDVRVDEILADLKMVLSNPNASTIGDIGHYCGPAAILNWLINIQPDVYTQVVLELSIYGKTKINKDTPEIKVPRALKKKVDYTIEEANENCVQRKDIGTTSISDFILGSSLVYSEKVIQKAGLLSSKATYNKKSLGSFIFTNTMPWEMDDYLVKLGASIEDQGYYLGDNEDIKELYKIEKAVNEGKMPIIFDNHNISYAQYQNLLYRFIGAHFITIHSFEVDAINNKINYSYWDYGDVKISPFLRPDATPFWSVSLKKYMRQAKRSKIKMQMEQITIDEFLKSMKGYWIPVADN